MRSLVARDTLQRNLLDRIDKLETQIKLLETHALSGTLRYGMIQGLFNLEGTALTIASGVITKAVGKIVWHRVDTQGAAASDDLTTINGGETGDILFLTAYSGARTVVLVPNAGNLKLSGSLTMDEATDLAVLFCYWGVWYEVAFNTMEAEP